MKCEDCGYPDMREKFRVMTQAGKMNVVLQCPKCKDITLESAKDWDSERKEKAEELEVAS